MRYGASRCHALRRRRLGVRVPAPVITVVPNG